VACLALTTLAGLFTAFGGEATNHRKVTVVTLGLAAVSFYQLVRLNLTVYNEAFFDATCYSVAEVIVALGAVAIFALAGFAYRGITA